MHSRVAIIGNAGSGKSYFAAALAKAWALPIVDLDALFWMPGGYTVKRPTEAVLEEIERRKVEPRWVFEGVYGELITPVLDRATLLVWLDLDWPTCRAAIESRHRQAGSLAEEGAGDSYAALVAYAEAYWTREGPRSHRGHQEIFDQFPLAKRWLKTRDEVAGFVLTI